jgi:hypothetical protein
MFTLKLVAFYIIFGLCMKTYSAEKSGVEVERQNPHPRAHPQAHLNAQEERVMNEEEQRAAHLAAERAKKRLKLKKNQNQTPKK